MRHWSRRGRSAEPEGPETPEEPEDADDAEAQGGPRSRVLLVGAY